MSDVKPRGPRGTDQIPLPPPIDPTDKTGDAPSERAPKSEPASSKSSSYKPAGKVMLAGAAASPDKSPKSRSEPPPALEHVPTATEPGGASMAPIAGSTGVPPTVLADDEPIMHIPPPPVSAYIPSLPHPKRSGGGSGFLIGGVVIVAALIGAGAWQVTHSSKSSHDKDDGKTIPIRRSGAPVATTPNATAVATNVPQQQTAAPPPVLTPTNAQKPPPGTAKPRASGAGSQSASSDPLGLPNVLGIPSAIASTLQFP